ncbi:hypothetical protein J7J26_01415 [Candidatus Micrarchaeota archaeon]|nr:hypothetical protein [Candidatus Micrarchaeota archaeon]
MEDEENDKDKQETIDKYEYDSVIIMNLEVINKQEPSKMIKQILTNFGEIINFDMTDIYKDFIKGRINETRFWRLLDIKNYSNIKEFIIRELDDQLENKYNILTELTRIFKINIIHEFPKEWFDEISEKNNITGISLKDINEEPYSKGFYNQIIENIRTNTGIEDKILLIDNDISRMKNTDSLKIKTCLILNKPLVKPDWYPNILAPDFSSLTNIKKAIQYF